MTTKQYFHAIDLINEKCKGCMHCVRICPTEALRIRDGRVHLDHTRCVDCGKCIGVCPFGAIVATSDPLSMINDFKYKVAIISTPFAGQFTEDIDYSTTIKALYHLGFDKVIEESMATNIMTKMKRHYIAEHKNIRPILSSNCPAVIRLIQVRFPSLLPNIFHVEAPMSVLSMYYREKYSKIQNLSPSDIGVFLIVPCIAQVAAVHQPQGAYKRIQEGAIAIRDIYNSVRNDLSTIRYLNYDFITHEKGLSRALSGQEADEVGNNKIRTIAVSGIENVIEILQKVEDHILDQYDYIVLRSCTSGCVGGILNVENPFIARSRIQSLIRNAEHHDHELDPIFSSYLNGEFDVLPLEPRSIMQLDKDMKQAIIKMKRLNEIKEQLPLIDCGACGTPNCQALAEDIVQGKASIEDCVILLKKNKNKNDDLKEGTMGINTKEFIKSIDGEVLTDTQNLENVIIEGGYVSDLLSDVMGNARENQVWITIMKHLNVIAVAALANMNCVCFANNVTPDQTVIDKAIEENVCLIKSGLSTFEIAGRLYQLMHQ